MNFNFIIITTVTNLITATITIIINIIIIVLKLYLLHHYQIPLLTPPLPLLLTDLNC